MFGLSMFLMGLVSSTPILLYVVMRVDRSVSKRTIELETENDELWVIRYKNADKIHELEEELANVSIDKDRLEIKYKKLLGEN